MSQAFDSTDYIARTASVPASTAFTIAAWVYINSLGSGVNQSLFGLGSGGWGADLACLRWHSSNVFRIYSNSGSTDFSSNPTAGAWYYFYLRSNGTTMGGGWKSIAHSDFSGRQYTGSAANNTSSILRCGATPLITTSLDMRVFRLSAWNEVVSDANLLLAAATDLGYTTNINTHLPLTQGIGSPWDDTSGNARNWTAPGTYSDEADPSLGGGGIPKTTKLTLLGVG